MQRLQLTIPVAVALLAAAPVWAAPAPVVDPALFVGNWKVINVPHGDEQVCALVQIEHKDGRFHATVLASPLLGQAKTSLENFTVADSTMQFDLKTQNRVLHAKVYVSKTDPKSNVAWGLVTDNEFLWPAQFVRTTATTLKATEAVTRTEGYEELVKACDLRDRRERQTALKELIQKRGDESVCYRASELLLLYYTQLPPSDDELRNTAEQFVKAGARFGPEIKYFTLATACQMVTRSDEVSPGAMEFVRNADKSLTTEVPTTDTATVVKSLVVALEKTGKREEAKALEARVAKLDALLDAEYEKSALPFKVEVFKGRKGSSQRVAVVEHFVNSHSTPSIGHEVAFDATLQAYQPKDVILLQYHVYHVPEPLVNADAEARLKYYRDANQSVGVCSELLNGKPRAISGANRWDGEDVYRSLRDDLNKALETDTTFGLKLKVERNGDKIDAVADVTGLKKPGENLRLRFVLLQDSVRFAGRGPRLHRHVVRALPGGVDGFALTEKEAHKAVTVDLVQLKKALHDYRSDFNKGLWKFREEESPLNLKNLKVVALIQDDDTKEILQAAQIDVPDAK